MGDVYCVRVTRGYTPLYLLHILCVGFRHILEASTGAIIVTNDIYCGKCSYLHRWVLV